MGEKVQLTPLDRASLAESRASSAATPGSKLAACARGGGEDGELSVDNVQADQERDAVPALLNGDPLEVIGGLRRRGPKKRTGTASCKVPRLCGIRPPDDLELRELLCIGHRGQDLLRLYSNFHGGDPPGKDCGPGAL
jgi:hypothetical protein